MNTTRNLPFDDAQLEIESSIPELDPEERPIGYINNNVRKNSPVFAGGNKSGNNEDTILLVNSNNCKNVSPSNLRNLFFY